MNEAAIEKEIKKLFSYLMLPLQDISIKKDEEIKIDIVSVNCSLTCLGQEDQKSFSRDFSFLLKALLEKKWGVKPEFIFDLNGVEKKMINAIKQKALIAAGRVRSFGKPYEFGQISSYERMIIHSVLKNESGIGTQSSGEGLDRRLSVVSL